MKELNFEHVVNRKKLTTETRINDGRTRDINLSVLIDLLQYVDTPRIRRKLDINFVETFEIYIDELIDNLSLDEMKQYLCTIEEIYELLYLRYPNIKRNFFECIRKRKTRLDEKGRTKWQVRRKSIAMKKAAVTRKRNTKLKNVERENKLYTFFSLMSQKIYE